MWMNRAVTVCAKSVHVCSINTSICEIYLSMNNGCIMKDNSEIK